MASASKSLLAFPSVDCEGKKSPPLVFREDNPQTSSHMPDDVSSAKAMRRVREQGWLKDIQSGNETSFELLYRAYFRPLVLFVLPLVESPAIAEEVVEDVFVHLWEHRTSIDIQCAVNTYIFSAARNRALNVARRMRVEQRWRDQQAQVSLAVEWDHVHSQTGDIALDIERVQHAVRNAIETLPEQRRRVLHLRWAQGMSYAEIAEVIGSSVVAVERQLSRTLKALRVILPEWLTADDRPRR